MKKHPVFTEKEKIKQRNYVLIIAKILGLKKCELAEALGVSRCLVSRWINGSCRISAAGALKLSKLVPDITVKQLCPHIYEGM